MSRSRRRTHLKNRTMKNLIHRGSEVIEPLEKRLLFTTIITDTDPLTPTPSTQSFEYKDARGNPVRVVVFGDISAEFIFARVTKGNKETFEFGNEVILGEFVPASAEQEDGRDLFHVYIAQASIDSYISIAQFDDSDTGPRPMTPFTGNVTLRINQLRTTDDDIGTDEGTGNIYLGARTRTIDFPDIDDEDNIPIRSDNFNGQGIAPVSIANRNGRLVAGLSTAPGVSLGKFLFAGTISGNVRIDGSVDTFYAGQLLTGVTEGDFFDEPTAPDNFYIGGDLRNLLVKGSLGTEKLDAGVDRVNPHYLSGTDIQVAGKVGQIKVGGSYAGYGEIVNNLPGLGLRTRQQEIEIRVPDNVNRGSFTEFQNGQLGDREAFFHNDTFETAQFLGSINSKQLGAGSAQVSGLYQWVPRTQDSADFYGVALMAGQSITVRLLAPIVFPEPTLVNGVFVTELPSNLHVGVYDPDGRLISTDYSNLGPESELTQFQETTEADPVHFQPFTFTADRPGIYRFAVGKDPTFANPGLRLGLEQPYQLQISGIGNLGLGAISAGTGETDTLLTLGLSERNPRTGLITPGTSPAMRVIFGDMGAVRSTGFIVGVGGAVAEAVGGNLRVLDGLSLGMLDPATGRFGAGPNIQVSTGSVGLIRSSGTGTEHYTSFNDSNQNPIHGDVQLFDAANPTYMYLVTNGSIGVIRSPNMATVEEASTIRVNVDGVGKPGVIDLIDVPGNFGTREAGGPLITTNVGGNVRYLNIGGTAFRPLLYGGSQPEETTYVQGQAAELTDDSGGQVVITPTIDRRINPTTGAVVDNSGILTLLTYPIARSPIDPGGDGGTGGGGVAIIRVQSTRGIGVRTNGGSVEIAEMISNGDGAGILPVPFDNGPDGVANTGDEPFQLDPNATSENSIDLRGATADVYRLNGPGRFDYIRNFTPGEIVNMNTGSVGLLEARTLGVARSSIVPGMATESTGTFSGSNTFPFQNARNAIVISGGGENSPAVLDIRSREELGNFSILGIVQNVEANSDNVGIKSKFEGINAPFVVQGDLRRIMIGEGILPSGSGNVAHAGIYVFGLGGGGGQIGDVINQGPGSDIRGDIVTNGSIGRILLNGGSIINADIFVGSSSATAGEGISQLAFSREFDHRNFNFVGSEGRINEVIIKGGGGIIGGSFIASNMGVVNVAEGFGIVNSRFLIQGNGRFAQVIAGGYGVRGTDWLGGQSIDGIQLTGDGARLSTTRTPIGVRMSELVPVDPLTGLKPNTLTDIHVALGTNKENPRRKGATSTGAMKASAVRVSRDVGPIFADSISTSVFNVGNNIASLVSASYTERVQVTAGRINHLHIGQDAIRTSVNISGPVNNVYIGGSFRGSSNLAAGGPNGTINTFVTDNTLYGNVSASQQINSIRVGTHYGSQGTHAGGNILQFVTGGHMLSSSVLSSTKDLLKLTVGGDFQDGAIVKVRSLGTKTVIGEDLGEVVLR